MRKSLLGTTALAAVVIALSAPLVPAEASPQTHQIKLTAPATPIGHGDFTAQGLSLETFNTTQGNLKSILVVEKLTASYSGEVTASSTTNKTSATPEMLTTLNVTGGPSALDGSPLLTAAGYYNVTGLTPTNPQNYAATNTPMPVSNAITSHFTGWESNGPGTFDVTLDSSSGLGAPLPGGWGFNPTVNLSFEIDYTYTYTTSSSNTAVPEPASALLLGTGVLALGKLRKRKKKPKA